jgi:nicotinate dehydrogenase subunit A
MATALELTVNGKVQVFDGDLDRPLLDVLRQGLGLTATRFGCGEGACGACHVLVDGRAVTACNTPLWSLGGKAVTTLEGLSGEADMHPLQQAFISEQAMQCGYCISGIIISAAALLHTNPDPTDAEVRGALDGNLCRCGSHNRIVRAVLLAATTMRGSTPHV